MTFAGQHNPPLRSQGFADLCTAVACRHLSQRHILRVCRRRPEEINLPGRVTASDAIMEEMCRAGHWVTQVAAAQAAAQSAAPPAELSAVLSPAPPMPPPARHIERPRQILRKAGQDMHQAVRNPLGRV